MTTEHRTKRTAARVAVAGAIIAAPLTALTVPAQAEAVNTPAATDIAHPGHGRGHGHGDWDRGRDRDWDRGWDRRGDWNPFDGPGRGWHGFRHYLPPGLFGSS